MKKLMMIMLALTITMIVMAACSKEAEPLRLGAMPTYSAAIYAVGIEKGFFEEAGVTVDLTVFRSSRDRDGAATAGELDGFMTDVMGAINLNAKGFPFTMTSREYEDFGVMAGSQVDVNTITNPKTGISENTVVEFIVDTYIQEDVVKVPIVAVPDRMGALLSGELDYGVFPQPFMGIIMGNAGQIVFNTAREDFYPVVLVFDDEYLKNNEKSVKAFYEGYNQTVEYMQSNPYNDYKDALVTFTLATEENVDLYRLPVNEYGLNGVDKTTFDSIMSWMEAKDLIDVTIEFDSIYNSKFMK